MAMLTAHWRPGSEDAVSSDRAPADPELQVHTMLGDDVEIAAGRKQGHGDLGRVPVAVLGPAPPWQSPALSRPVVAVLDTGVDPHPWLGGAPGDPVVLDARERGWHVPALGSSGDNFRGHGTFIAGLIRQTAPDSRVLSLPIMNNDGIVQGADSLRALHWLAGEQQDGQPALAIDVLCVAYGYEPGRADADHTARLRSVLWQLAGCGVIVVASAGNDGDDSPVYPAAFAVDPNPPPVPIISVGATNPDGSYAHYSNYGVWVTHRAVGSGVISTITAFDGSRVAPRQTAYPDSIGVPIDPDDFRGGFARWSGTSFAAATVAGRLALALSGPQPASASERIGRARRAVDAIGSQRS